MIKYTITDKDNTAEPMKVFDNYGKLVIVNANTGVVELSSNYPRNMSISNILISPGEIAYTVKVEILLPDDSWSLIKSDIVAGATVEAHIIDFCDKALYFNNKARISITNTDGAEITVYFNIQAFDRDNDPKKKY